MFIETDPTLPLIGTDLFLRYSEWQDILFEKSLSENKILRTCYTERRLIVENEKDLSQYSFVFAVINTCA